MLLSLRLSTDSLCYGSHPTLSSICWGQGGGGRTALQNNSTPRRSTANLTPYTSSFQSRVQRKRRRFVEGRAKCFRIAKRDRRSLGESVKLRSSYEDAEFSGLLPPRSICDFRDPVFRKRWKRPFAFKVTSCYISNITRT